MRRSSCGLPVDKTSPRRDVLRYSSSVRRLIIRPGAIGDFVVSLPALQCLKQEYTEVWTAAPNVPLARFADRARAISATRLDLLGIVEPPSQLLNDLATF